jgi:hypothetical protein
VTVRQRSTATSRASAWSRHVRFIHAGQGTVRGFPGSGWRPGRVTLQQVETGRSPRDEWTRKLAEWEMPWLPLPGWRRALLRGEDRHQHGYEVDRQRRTSVVALPGLPRSPFRWQCRSNGAEVVVAAAPCPVVADAEVLRVGRRRREGKGRRPLPVRPWPCEARAISASRMVPRLLRLSGVPQREPSAPAAHGSDASGA